MASNVVTDGRARAAEARKRKHDEQAALNGMIASIQSQQASDEDFVIQSMKDDNTLATRIAGLIRSGRFKQAKQAIEEQATAPKLPTELGRPLGNSVKTFKKLGISILTAFLARVSDGDDEAKRALMKLIRTTTKDGDDEVIGADKVGELWHFVLDVNDMTKLPTAHDGVGFLNPLPEVLFLRYKDCGSRLSPCMQKINPLPPAFWHFDPQGPSPKSVTFRLGDATLALELHLAEEVARSTTDWKLEAPHTFYAHLSAASKFLSIPLGAKLEETHPAACKSLPMFDPQDSFEYPDAWDRGSVVPSTPASVASSAPSVPVAPAAVLAQLPQHPGAS